MWPVASPASVTERGKWPTNRFLHFFPAGGGVKVMHRLRNKNHTWNATALPPLYGPFPWGGDWGGDWGGGDDSVDHLPPSLTQAILCCL